MKNRPTEPSGVQAQMPIRPPGFITRAISAAVARWSGANMQPNTEITESKLESSKGSCSASPSGTHTRANPVEFA
jgi:hypothetical protein